MKLKNTLYSALTALTVAAALSACSGNSEGDSQVRTLGDYKNLTTGDSVGYYVGQMASLEFWGAARQDTLLKSREARDSYLKGLRAGYDAVRDDDSYNQGFYAGVQLAMQMKEFASDYKTTVNKKVLIDAFEDGLKNDSILNPGDVQRGFTELTMTLQARKDAEDRMEAEATLKDFASKDKLQMINASLYAATAKGGEGEKVKEGDKVGFSMTISDLSGKVIDRRDNPDLEVGKMYAGPATQAMLSMRPGETRTFYTYAQAILGRFAQRYGLKGSELVSFTIVLTKAEAKSTVTSDEAAD